MIDSFGSEVLIQTFHPVITISPKVSGVLGGVCLDSNEEPKSTVNKWSKSMALADKLYFFVNLKFFSIHVEVVL